MQENDNKEMCSHCVSTLHTSYLFRQWVGIAPFLHMQRILIDVFLIVTRRKAKPKGCSKGTAVLHVAAALSL